MKECIIVLKPNNYYTSRFLNTLTPNGLTPHVLSKEELSCHIAMKHMSYK
jgi:hypothetical protein